MLSLAGASIIWAFYVGVLGVVCAVGLLVLFEFCREGVLEYQDNERLKAERWTALMREASAPVYGHSRSATADDILRSGHGISNTGGR